MHMKLLVNLSALNHSISQLHPPVNIRVGFGHVRWLIAGKSELHPHRSVSCKYPCYAPLTSMATIWQWTFALPSPISESSPPPVQESPGKSVEDSGRQASGSEYVPSNLVILISTSANLRFHPRAPKPLIRISLRHNPLWLLFLCRFQPNPLMDWHTIPL